MSVIDGRVYDIVTQRKSTIRKNTVNHEGPIISEQANKLKMLTIILSCFTEVIYIFVLLTRSLLYNNFVRTIFFLILAHLHTETVPHRRARVGGNYTILMLTSLTTLPRRDGSMNFPSSGGSSSNRRRSRGDGPGLGFVWYDVANVLSYRQNYGYYGDLGRQDKKREYKRGDEMG